MNEFPKHIVSVSAYIENEKQEILLVRTQWRSDTWEIPGGRVEVGESLDQAVQREVLEETGIQMTPHHITGVYSNITAGVVCIVFYGTPDNTEIKIDPSEIIEAKWIHIDYLKHYVTRPHFLQRILDAKDKMGISYEAWLTEPYQKVSRLPKKF